MRDESEVRLESLGILHIAEACATRYAVTVADIMSKKRTAAVSRARQLFCGVLSTHGWSSVEIGKCVGRDHTTVLQALNKISKRDIPAFERDLDEQVRPSVDPTSLRLQ